MITTDAAPRVGCVRLRFSVDGCAGATSAALIGDLTAWVPIEMPFDGSRFAIAVAVPRGRDWHYRVLIDGRSVHDPAADDVAPWDDGSIVSIRHT